MVIYHERHDYVCISCKGKQRIQSNNLSTDPSLLVRVVSVKRHCQ